MTNAETKKKADLIRVTVQKYRSDIRIIKKKLTAVTDRYHGALKEEKLKKIRQEILKL